MKKRIFITIIALIFINSCAVQSDIVLSDTTSIDDVYMNNTESSASTIYEKNPVITTTTASPVTETTANSIITEVTIDTIIDNYNPEDYNPLYIDFNKDGVDEIVYRIPNNPIEKRVCIEIDGNETLLPDINAIYCYYSEEFNSDTNKINTHGEFLYAYSNFGYMRLQGFFVPEWSHGLRWEWDENQYFTGINDSCMGVRQAASDSQFHNVINDNDLSKYYGIYQIEKFNLGFYDEHKRIGYVEVDYNNTKISFDQFDIPDVEENIKLSNSKNYSITTFSPDQMYLYKRQRLLNTDYDGDDRQTEEQTEYFLLLKHESDKIRVIDGIFLGTEKEEYLAHYFRYVYDVENNEYIYNDIKDGIATDDIFPYTRIISKSKKSSDYVAQYCRYSYKDRYDGYVYNNITDTTASEEFDYQWNIAGNQQIDDRWELVEELTVIENE
jgi:hypothetical protein